MSENIDPEMEKLMAAKFKKLQAINSDPQERANVLVQRYVNIIDKILLGSENYKEDFELLTQIREEATAFGLMFQFDVKVKTI